MENVINRRFVKFLQPKKRKRRKGKNVSEIKGRERENE